MFKGFKNALSRKLLATSLISVFIVAVVLTVLIEWLVLKNSEEQLLEQQKSFTQTVANRIDQGLNHRLEALQGLSELLKVDDRLVSEEQIQRVLDERLLLKRYFNNGLVFISADGFVKRDSPTVPGRVGLDVRERAYFKRISQTLKPYITQPIIGKATPEPLFLMLAPVLNSKGEALGYVLGATRLIRDNLLISISKEAMGDQGTLWVLDLAKDLVITSTRTDQVMAKISASNLSDLSDSLTAQGFRGRATDGGNNPVVYTATPLKSTRWLVVHAFPKEKLLAPAKKLLIQISLLVCLLLLLAGVVTYAVIARLMRPLKCAADQIGDMLEGKQEIQPLRISQQDEVGLLVTAFNQLLEHQEIQAEQLKAEKSKADEASRAKSEFLANMSHEIRTPLNAVIGLSELQLSESLPVHIRQRTQQIHRSGELLLGIVNDLLDFSKIEAGKMESHLELFCLDDVIEHLSSLFALSSSKKELELLLHIQPDLPEWYRGDALHLTQVLSNLIGNAVKFTDLGSVELFIEQGDKGKLHFTIRDTGIGMSPEQQQRLFKAFSQADTSITRRHGGTGLGLIISQRLVQIMGGEGIHLHSDQGAGSQFEFTLPLPEAGDLSKSNHLNSPSVHKAFSGQTKDLRRVLVVDDHPLARQILREILHTWNLVVVEAEDALQAVSLFKQSLQPDQDSDQNSTYDLVLMDWNMPHLNGLKALHQIREVAAQYQQSAPPALLMLSAHEQAEIQFDKEESVQFLSKPVHRSCLFDAINQLFNGNQSVKTKEQTSFGGQRILVVEDNQINQQVVQAQLEQLGLKVSLADNGALGVDKARSEHFDLVLMDIQMPEMDGYQASKEIRRFNQQVPIIALTAAAMFEDKQKALQAGMNDHLGKPFSSQQLVSMLQNWLPQAVLPGKIAQDNDKQQSSPISAGQPPAELSEALSYKQQASLMRKATLLIVDDQAANIKVFASLLKEDYNIQVANNGIKALEIARKTPAPDLILLDIMMPDMDGYSVCRELKNDPATHRIPIIFISALDDARDETTGLDLGAVDYISKPFHPDIVRSRIRNQISLKIKTDLLEEMSFVDGLTQIANRRQLDLTLKEELAKHQQSREPIALIMLDIDYFKPFNDNYGHGKGDECLVKIAATLRETIPQSEGLLARYGGEEFVVILPRTSSETVCALAEKMRAAVDNMAFPHQYSELCDHVTISLGAVSGVPEALSPDQLLQAADQALYQAKAQGRHQLVYHPLYKAD